FYEQLSGKTVKAAQKQIAELLRDPAGSASGSGAPLIQEPTPIEHSVKFFEKGDRPLEFMRARQWFVRLLDKKDQLIKMGNRIQWHPDFMRARFQNWTENLQFDWCISRQRYFGVAFPMWYPIDSEGQPDYDHPIVATPEMLPVDPMVTPAPGYDESERDKSGGFTGEADVYDTWFTSSMSPEIGSRWQLDPVRHAKLFPTDVRPQSHEIIRTWAFYTIAKAMLHEGVIPWNHALISGWILDPENKDKLSKTKHEDKNKRKVVVTPMDMIDEYGADGARYWSANAKLGADTLFDLNVLKIGRRLVTKIFNASKFVLSQTAEAQPITRDLDLAFVLRLKQLIVRTTEAFENFEYTVALAETEKFFWNDFTDTFIELVKIRSRAEEDAEGRGSAVAALRFGLNTLLRLFAPFLPYITEEVWSWAFAVETGQSSIHRSAWPSDKDFASATLPADGSVFEAAVACWDEVNKRKSDAKVPVGRSVQSMTIAANAVTLATFKKAEADIVSATRALTYNVVEDGSLENGVFDIR
ncbi:MAG: class I tRNA ligase family protein, partial [Blastocatellia bacterium]